MEHFSEERLLELADSGLDDAHLHECAECRAAVDEQRAALTALMAAPVLELPRERVREIVAALPDQTPVRRLRGWPQRLAILAPVAAAAIAVMIVSNRGEDLPQREGADDAAVAMSAPAQEDARAGAELQAIPQKRACGAGTQTLITKVLGPPDEVVALLRDVGIDAVQCNGAVEVPGPETGRVLELLGERPDGAVEVRTN